ncbi:MAG: DUF47 family protein [Bacteroidales bacterium]|nr:DUF47 family protein [Bacteroidales bacterium]
MNLDRIFGFLVPKNRKFFPLFKQSAEALVEGSGLLVKLFEEEDVEKRDVIIKEIKKVEKKADEITRHLSDELNGTFITPFDREDVHDLINSLDDVIDYIDAAAKRVYFYKVHSFPPEFVKIACLIHNANLEILSVLSNIKHASDFSKFQESYQKIDRYETEVDDIYQHFLANLFDFESNAVELIKKRDILMALEKAIDRCDDVRKVFSTIMVKLS